MHLPKVLFADQAIAVDDSAIEVEEGIFCHVRGRRDDRAGRGEGAQVHVRGLDEGAVCEDVTFGGLLVLGEGLDFEVRGFHSERLKDSLANEFLIGRAGEDFDEVAGERDHLVGVLEFGSESRVGLEVFERTDHLGAVFHDAVYGLKVVFGNAGAVAHEVADGDVFRQEHAAEL